MGEVHTRTASVGKLQRWALLGPAALLWNILWAFLGESETIPQGNMRSQEEKVPGRDLRVTVPGARGSLRPPHPVPNWGLRTVNRLKGEGYRPQSNSDPSPRQDRENRKTYPIVTPDPKKMERGRLTQDGQLGPHAHSDTASNINPPVSHPALNPGPPAAVPRLQDHPLCHGS